MNELNIDKASNNPSDAASLASEMHRVLGDAVAVLEKHWQLSRADAIGRIHEGNATDVERARTKPACHLTWLDLFYLSRHSPELSEQRWQEVQQAARSELQTGHRAASMVEQPDQSHCLERARFLALRSELLESWQPRNAAERVLIDSLAQTQSQYERWLNILTSRMTIQVALERKDEGRWTPARQSEAEAIEQSAGMVERFHRMMLRSIRALQNLRRHSPVVLVQNAGQVNVAQQQINAVAG